MNTVEKSHLWASTGYYFFKFLRVDAVVKEVGWKGIGRGGGCRGGMATKEHNFPKVLKITCLELQENLNGCG